ncbi:type VI secretion system tube protein TssD [Roseateles paludis]|jgi:type VI secretion system secreted protein Hcp|uniref:Type VI secretion system tube protein TssD n=1 Tax=Roseateles paludis TaxID=3145238 RepID=A0ABV0FX83_9BURK
MRLLRLLSVSALALASVAFVLPAQAEPNAYLFLKGSKGDIKGDSRVKGREDAIVVIAASHELNSPRDAASGLPSGKRQHRPFVITKELDRSTPLLRHALVTNETLPSATIDFYRPTPRGGLAVEEKYLTIKLTNASIATIRQVMLNNKNPELVRYAQNEEVSFTYQKIEWIWVDGGVTASDDWQAPIN